MQRNLFDKKIALTDFFPNKEKKLYHSVLGEMESMYLNKCLSCPPVLYQSNNLDALLNKYPVASEEDKMVRFVVRSDNTLIFSTKQCSAFFQLAIEGEQPRDCASIHALPEFIAAGIATFNKNHCLTVLSRANCDELNIPHASLYFALKACVEHNVPLADNVEISTRNNATTLSFSKEEILKTYQTSKQKLTMSLINQ